MSTATPALPTSVSLYYKEGSSNKEYHVQVTGNDDDGYRINFQYGRVGSKLQTGTKTKIPVDLATAISVMGELIAEKQRKGYTTGESGTPYQDTPNAGKVSGVLPQLLNFIDEEEVERLINDESWVMQEKKDGVRSMIKKTKGKIEGINKKGLVVSLPKAVEDAVVNVCGKADAILDGELVGETYWLFDLLSIGVHSFADKSYRDRLAGMQEWLAEGFGESFTMVPTAVGKASKKAMLTRLKKENAEGVVFKQTTAPYKAGRPASGGTQVKFKFYAEATVRVKSLNNAKNSFQMEVLEKGNWKYIGDCTYYPTVFVPDPEDVVEVRYLYAYPGGSLFQPILKGPRLDQDEGDCLMSQLKYKQGTTEDDQDDS